MAPRRSPPQPRGDAMKAPGFWYVPQATAAARLLAPLGAIYTGIGRLRRALASPYRAGVPVICIGNVVAGGAGKTPTALALAALLQQLGKKPVFVSRGYGGTQRGPVQVDPRHHGADDVGDEPLLLQRQAPAWIGRDRAAAIRQAEKNATHIIMDDGLQHPHVQPDISLLVIDAPVGFGNGLVMPAGPLREPLADILPRVTAIVLIGDGAIPDCGKPVLHAHLRPVIPAGFPAQEKFLAFAGIGRPSKFYAAARGAGLTIVATRDFADHHPFGVGELEHLENDARAMGARLLTTDKDFVRLPAFIRPRVLTLPIQLVFDAPGALTDLLACPR